MSVTNVQYFGKDCPEGMVQVEFVGCRPENRISDYGWKPEPSAFLELWVDGQRFRVDMGDIRCADGTTRRGLRIFVPVDADVERSSVNVCDILLAATPAPEAPHAR